MNRFAKILSRLPMERQYCYCGKYLLGVGTKDFWLDDERINHTLTGCNPLEN